jgi:putative transposase
MPAKEDLFIACVDGLKSFPKAIETVYPKTQVQLYLVHLMRFSLSYVSFKDWKAVASDLKTIYCAAVALKLGAGGAHVRPA